MFTSRLAVFGKLLGCAWGAGNPLPLFFIQHLTAIEQRRGQVPVAGNPDHESMLASKDPALAANKRLVYDFWREVFEAAQMDKAEKYMAADYIQHNPLVPTGRQAFVDFFSRIRKPSPVEAKIKAPVVAIMRVPNVMIVNPSVPVKSLAELIALAKAKPGKLNSAVPGLGTLQHLVTEWFRLRAGVNIASVPYKGGAPLYQDMLGGRVPVAFAIMASAMPLVKSGKLKALAVTNAQRSVIYPDFPPIGAAVHPSGACMKNWAIRTAPRKVPALAMNETTTIRQPRRRKAGTSLARTAAA